MKRFAIALVFALATLASAQTDNTLYAKQFPGADVGTKVQNAMQACNPNAAIPCVIVLDPSLAIWPAGTMPPLCAQCTLADYRAGFPGQVPNNVLTIQPDPATGDFSARTNAAILSSPCAAPGGCTIHWPTTGSTLRTILTPVLIQSDNVHLICDSKQPITIETQSGIQNPKVTWFDEGGIEVWGKNDEVEGCSLIDQMNGGGLVMINLVESTNAKIHHNNLISPTLGNVTGYATTSSAGTGYTTASGLATTTDGAGTGATVNITATAGAITGVTIANAGAGYNYNDLLYIVQAGASGGNATAIGVAPGTGAVTTIQQGALITMQVTGSTLQVSRGAIVMLGGLSVNPALNGSWVKAEQSENLANGVFHALLISPQIHTSIAQVSDTGSLSYPLHTLGIRDEGNPGGGPFTLDSEIYSNWASVSYIAYSVGDSSGGANFHDNVSDGSFQCFDFNGQNNSPMPDAYGIKFHGNTCKNDLAPGYVESARDVAISDNTFINDSTVGNGATVRIHNTLSADPALHVSISGNHFIGTPGQNYAVHVFQNIADYQITNNDIRGYGSSGIYIDSSDGPPFDGLVSGNIIANWGTSTSTPGAYCGIEMHEGGTAGTVTSYLTVIDNSFENYFEPSSGASYTICRTGQGAVTPQYVRVAGNLPDYGWNGFGAPLCSTCSIEHFSYGAGASIASGPATSTANDCAKFADATGTLADSGSPCATPGGNVATATNFQTPISGIVMGNGASIPTAATAAQIVAAIGSTAVANAATAAAMAGNALPAGTTATSGSTGDNTNKVATDSFVYTNATGDYTGAGTSASLNTAMKWWTGSGTATGASFTANMPSPALYSSNINLQFCWDTTTKSILGVSLLSYTQLTVTGATNGDGYTCVVLGH